MFLHGAGHAESGAPPYLQKIFEIDHENFEIYHEIYVKHASSSLSPDPVSATVDRVCL
jgi:hypothetical protein